MATVETDQALKAAAITRLQMRQIELIDRAMGMRCTCCGSDRIMLRTPAIIPACWRCQECGQKWQHEP